MKKIILFLFLTTFIICKNIKINLDEEGINKFIKTVGSFSKTTKIINTNVIWKVYDAKLDLVAKNPMFTAKLDIITESKYRSGTIEGEARFRFNPENQTLMIDIDNMKIRGVDIFNIAEFYRPKYELPIRIIQKEKISIKEDGKTTSYVIPRIYNESVTVINGFIIIEADISFTEEKK